MANKLRKQHMLLMHEALDRTRVASTFVQSILMDHGGIIVIPKAVRKIDRAVELLEQAYQIIGRAAMNKDHIPKLKAKKRRKKSKGEGVAPAKRKRKARK